MPLQVLHGTRRPKHRDDHRSVDVVQSLTGRRIVRPARGVAVGQRDRTTGGQPSDRVDECVSIARAVGREFDAVHLTVDGYLSTAGRALPVDVPGAGRPVRTLLGGWDPDATWWLTDVLPALGAPTDWRRQDDEPPRWAAG